jgi:hypothetical protein
MKNTNKFNTLFLPSKKNRIIMEEIFVEYSSMLTMKERKTYCNVGRESELFNVRMKQENGKIQSDVSI